MHAGSHDQIPRDQPRPRRPGPVLAAVHDPDLAAAVALRAGEHARAMGRSVLVLTLVPIAAAHGLGPGGRLPGELDDYDDARAIIREAERALEALGVAYQVELCGYLARGAPRRQARRLAATVLRAAGQLGAEVITIGRPRGRAPSGTSVAARVVNGAPVHMQVSVASAPVPALGRARRGAGSRRRAAHAAGGIQPDQQTVGDPAAVVLTRQGRRLLARRAHQLRAHVLPRLRAALDGHERDAHVEAEYQRVVDQLRRLSWLVEHAPDAEDLPDDPATVELGETVTVQVGGGAPEQCLIVHPVEAPLDDVPISADSPLARAVLGRRIGDEVEVAAPAGAYRCRILAADRTAPVRG
ncbi:MAG TPA: GreA/GreB family elongation factor [Actinomycetes bacterium]